MRRIIISLIPLDKVEGRKLYYTDTIHLVREKKWQVRLSAGLPFFHLPSY
ncbi:MAG: hypothetical protein K2K74_19950 [Lachnospiraceae bacterium]|nr:hypothetical protein [Lachnospiraceae bacterium]